MSDELHPVRLWWCEARGRGIARHDGVEVQLRRRPSVLRGSRVIELEYLPSIACCYVQEVGQGRRDMQDGEAAECLAYLRAMAVETRNNMEAWRG